MKHASQIIALLATLLLTACATSEVVPDGPAPERPETALSFTAYVARDARTPATPDNIADVDALAQVGGFGVIGYAHGQRLFDNYVQDVTYPNFFVNQQVTYVNDDDGHWTYEPVKYYDNNPGALHSFFAYAPYDKGADIVYATGKAPQVRYTATRDIDLLWAEPTTNLPKPDTDAKVTFNFAHALTKTTFHVAPFIDKVHPDEGDHADAGHTHPISDPLPVGTTVKVKSIHLNGLIPHVALLNTADGKWTTTQTRQFFDVPGANAASWDGDGITIQLYRPLAPNKLIPSRTVNIEVIYDVISEANGQKSHLTRKAVSQESIDLDQSKAYNIYLDLGLNSVKFVTTSSNWTSDDHDVELPEEELDPIQIETVLSVIIDWQAGVSDENTVW